MLVVGQSYVKHHKVSGYQSAPREFLGESEFGYLLFAGPEEGQIMSESREVWDFYTKEDAPTPNVIPDGWLEGAGGYYDRATIAQPQCPQPK